MRSVSKQMPAVLSELPCEAIADQDAIETSAWVHRLTKRSYVDTSKKDKQRFSTLEHTQPTLRPQQCDTALAGIMSM